MPTSDIRTPDVENLLEVLAAIDDKDTLFALMEDMFTIREIRESSQRLAVARMLDDYMEQADLWQGKNYLRSEML